MPNLDLFGPNLKIERAEHHIRKLKTIFGQYVRDNLKRIRPERKRHFLKQGRVNRPATFPKHTPTILGDALHNLHAALDHAYHIAAEANGAAFDEYRKFPFGKDRQSLEGQINGHKKQGTAPSDKVIIAILDQIQPHEGGALGLYGLHKLDITDKHIVLIPTTSRMKIERLDFVDHTGTKTGGGLKNVTLDIEQPQKGGEFINVGPRGAILQGNPQDTFQICFSEGQPFEGNPIIETVQSLRNATIEALRIIDGAS